MIDRIEGFASALAGHGLKLEPDFQHRTSLTMEGGRLAARSRLAGSPKPTPVLRLPVASPSQG